jgi:hypothetical protein
MSTVPKTLCYVVSYCRDAYVSDPSQLVVCVELWMYAHTTQVQVLVEPNLSAYFFFLVPPRVADFFFLFAWMHMCQILKDQPPKRYW